MQRIFVGDVQGCAEELEQILGRARAQFGTGYDLLATGDVINRGPGSYRALARVREHVEVGRGQMVLGNHELAFLRVALGLAPSPPSATWNDLLGRPDLASWVDWLLRRPLAVFSSFGSRPFAMVHAAVPPRASLGSLRRLATRLQSRLATDARTLLSEDSSDRDRLARLVSCRSVLADGGWSARQPQDHADSRAQPWHAAWSQAGHDYGVVYGHWAQQGLHVAPGLRGLDTGCVHEGRGAARYLTAWIPDERRRDPFAVPDKSFWHVRARRPYWRD